MVKNLKLQLTTVTNLPNVKYIENNRFEFSQKHIDKLAESISKFGSNISPVLITKDNYVLDGQHRIKAYEQTLEKGEVNSLNVARLDKNFKGNEKFFKDMLSEVNNKVGKWGIQDWLMHYIHNENYKKLKDLWDKYPELSLAALRTVACEKGEMGGGISKRFVEGNFVYAMTDTKQEILDYIALRIQIDFPIPANVWKQGAVLKALVSLSEDPAFTPARMFSQIAKNLGTFQVQSGIGNWCGYFKALYNKGLKDRSKRIKKKFITSY